MKLLCIKVNLWSRIIVQKKTFSDRKRTNILKSAEQLTIVFLFPKVPEYISLNLLTLMDTLLSQKSNSFNLQTLQNLHKIVSAPVVCYLSIFENIYFDHIHFYFFPRGGFPHKLTGMCCSYGFSQGYLYMSSAFWFGCPVGDS